MAHPARVQSKGVQVKMRNSRTILLKTIERITKDSRKTFVLHSADYQNPSTRYCLAVKLNDGQEEEISQWLTTGEMYSALYLLEHYLKVEEIA